MLPHPVCWIRKREDQMHIFDWEAILMVPTATGRRSVRTSAGRAGDYFHIWFAGALEVLRHFQQTLFHPSDPISGDAARFLYTLLLTPHQSGSISQSSRVVCREPHSAGALPAYTITSQECGTPALHSATATLHSGRQSGMSPVSCHGCSPACLVARGRCTCSAEP